MHRVQRGWCFAALATLFALPVLAQSDICSAVPPGGDATNIPVESYERRAGIYGKCVSLYTNVGQATVFLWKTPEMARNQVDIHKTASERDHMGFERDPNPTATFISGYGDYAVEVNKDQTPPGETDSPVRYNIAFSRGCYQVFVNAGGALGMSFIAAGGEQDWERSKQWVRDTSATIAQNIRDWPCPDGGGTTPPPPPPPNELGVTIECQSNYDQADLVVCTAQAQGARPDAVLSYQWTFDSAAQSITGSELTLTGVQPGPHTATVVASDGANQLVSNPQSASFTKEARGTSGGGGIPGGGSSSGPPIVPIVIITTIALGGIGTGIAIATRKRPRPPNTTPPAGPPPAPPEQLAPLRPLAPQVLGAPPRPAPTPTPPPPEKLVAPAAPPSPAPPIATSPKDGDDHSEGELWLEAGRAEVTILADGRQETIVTVRACEKKNGIVVDASADVTPAREISLPKKIWLTSQPGYCAFGIRGTHAGSTPVTGRITIKGTSKSGRSVRPAAILVHLEPVKIEVKIKVWKKGFRFQEIAATLPGMCRDVRARAEGGEELSASEGFSANALAGGELRYALAKAHCTASIRTGTGNWSSPVEVRSNDRGEFYFGLPPRMVQVYGEDFASYEMPKPFQLGLDDDVKDALRGFRTAFVDLRQDLTTVAPGKEYTKALEGCLAYPSEAIRQLCANEEEDAPRVVSAIHRLRCSILFALKYRKDVYAQRRIIDYAASEALGSVVDVITDFLPVAMGIFKWLGGKTFERVIGGTRYVMPGFPQFMFDLAKGVKRTPGMRFLSKALLLVVRFLRSPVTALEKSVLWLLESALTIAETAGLKTQYLKDLSRLGRDAAGNAITNDVPISSIFNDPTDPVLEVAKVFSESAHSVVRSTLQFVFGLFHGLVIIVAGALKGIAFFIRNMDWGADSGWAATIGEVIEDLLGKTAGAIYDNFGQILDSLIRGPELGGGKPSELQKKNAADVVLDALVTMQELDARCARELELAYLKSSALDVTNAWQDAVRAVSKQELTIMARFEKAKDAVNVLDTGAPFVKLAVKVVQAVTFAWGTLSSTAVKVAGKVAEALPSLPYLRDFQKFLGTTGPEAMEFASYFERMIDIAELVLVRGPIMVKEIFTLKILYAMAPTRIKALYEK